jgi:hypothetical protein
MNIACYIRRLTDKYMWWYIRWLTDECTWGNWCFSQFCISALGLPACRTVLDFELIFSHTHMSRATSTQPPTVVRPFGPPPSGPPVPDHLPLFLSVARPSQYSHEAATIVPVASPAPCPRRCPCPTSPRCLQPDPYPTPRRYRPPAHVCHRHQHLQF